MGAGIDIPQVLAHDLVIHLGGGDIRVAQQFLDGLQVCPVLQEVGSEGVPQGVGVISLVMPAFC